MVIPNGLVVAKWELLGCHFNTGCFLCSSITFGKALFLHKGKTWGRKSTPAPLLFIRHATERQVDATSCCSVAKSCPTLQPKGQQHARLPCPSPFPGVCSNSYPLSWWYHPTISSSVVPFSSRPQSFPASGSFPKSWLFALGVQRIGASASTSVLSMCMQGWYFC